MEMPGRLSMWIIHLQLCGNHGNTSCHNNGYRKCVPCRYELIYPALELLVPIIAYAVVH